MKRTNLSIAAAAALMLGFASCQTETSSTGWSQAQVDSAVNARVDEMRMQMEASNDSLINARAALMADSILAATKGVTTTRTTTTTSTTKPNGTGGIKTPPAPPPTTIGNGKPVIGDSRNNNGTTIGNGKPVIGDQQNKNSNTIGNGKPKMGGR